MTGRAKPLQFELVGVAFNALELGVHFARRVRTHAMAQLFDHGYHHFGCLIEKFNLLTKTLSAQIFGAD